MQGTHGCIDVSLGLFARRGQWDIPVEDGESLFAISQCIRQLDLEFRVSIFEKTTSSIAFDPFFNGLAQCYVRYYRLVGQWCVRQWRCSIVGQPGFNDDALIKTGSLMSCKVMGQTNEDGTDSS